MWRSISFLDETERSSRGPDTHTHSHDGTPENHRDGGVVTDADAEKKATTRVLDRCVMFVIIDLALLVCVILSVILEHSSSFGFNRFKSIGFDASKRYVFEF